jgi:hypothetical protein
MTYKSYWHSTIISKLEEYRRLQMNVTVTQLRFYIFFLFTIKNKTYFFLFSTDTGICIEDVIQTLIDLRLAHTVQSTNEITLKQNEIRHRRRYQNQCDNNNNNLDVSSLLIIDDDVLRTAMNRLSNGNLSLKNNQNIFDPTSLRIINRR